MITTFPKVTEAQDKQLLKLLHASIKKNAPILSAIKHVRYFEGDCHGIVRQSGDHVVSPFESVESGFSIPNDDASRMSTDSIGAKFEEVAHEMAGQMERHIVQTMHSAIQESGNVLPGNPKLSLQSFLSALRLLPVDFVNDDRSKPVIPGVIAPKQAIAALIEHLRSCSPEDRRLFEQQQSSILDEKHAEHLADLESRTLVD